MTLRIAPKLKGTKVGLFIYLFIYFIIIIIIIIIIILKIIYFILFYFILFLGLAYQGKDIIVIIFIIEYSSLRDFGP
jgi:hypothetical protein